MKKHTAKKAIGFTSGAKERALHDLGFFIMEYSGKIADAPSQIRHLARELKAGIYLVNLTSRTIVKRLDINASGHKFVPDQASLLNETFKEAVIHVLQTDYVYVLKNADGSFDFMGNLADNSSIKANIMAELSRFEYVSGYYGVQMYGTEIIFITHVYQVFETLVMDLALYAPVSPFKPYAAPITSSQYESLELEYTKFGFSGDAVITLTGAKNGKLVATVVNYPEIDGIERLFVKAPTLLNLALRLANSDMTAETIVQLKTEAQQIIGAIEK